MTVYARITWTGKKKSMQKQTKTVATGKYTSTSTHTKICCWCVPEQAFKYICFILNQDYVFLVTTIFHVLKPVLNSYRKHYLLSFVFLNRPTNWCEKLSDKLSFTSYLCYSVSLFIPSSHSQKKVTQLSSYSKPLKAGTSDTWSTVNTWTLSTVTY